ncbi:MAG: glycosyltransferase family 4 protein, partial [Acidimicrobiales bacterium]
LGVGDRPYLLELGRIDDHKGSKMLNAYFRCYKERRPGPLALAHVGPLSSDIQAGPDVVITGPVGESEKWDLLRDSAALVSASALESFSIVVMEAWQQGVPVIVNSACDPTREHCEESGGGLWFGSYREFEVILDALSADRRLRHRLGKAGQHYVREHFAWPAVVDRYARFLSAVAEHAGPPSQVHGRLDISGVPSL